MRPRAASLWLLLLGISMSIFTGCSPHRTSKFSSPPVLSSADKSHDLAAKRSTAVVYECPPVSPGMVKVDGSLDEPAWSTAIPSPVQFIPEAGDRKWPHPAGVVRMLHTNEGVFIGVEISDEDVRSTNEATGRHDDLSVDAPNDSVTLLIDALHDDEHFVKVVLSPSGAFSDRFVLRPRAQSPLRSRLPYGLMEFKDFSLTELQVGVRTNGTMNKPEDNDQGWTCELFVPFKALLLTGGDTKYTPVGGKWRMEIAITNWTGKGRHTAVWSPTTNAWMEHDIARWGTVVFRPNAR